MPAKKTKAISFTTSPPGIVLAWLIALRDLIRAGSKPRIEELEGEGFAANNGYELSAALVEYIVRTYGEGKLRSLLKDPRNLEKELSIAMPNLNKNWHEDLMKTYQ